MGHQAEHIACRIGQAGHIAHRAIGIVGIAEHHPPLLLQLIEVFGIELVAALTVGDRQRDRFAEPIGLKPRTGGIADHEVHGLAEEMKVSVAGEGTGQQAHLREHLKSVADTQNRPTIGGEVTHGLQQRRKAGNCPAA